MPLSSGASGLATVGNHPEQQKGNKKAPNRQTSGKSLRSNRSSKKNMDPGPTIVTEKYGAKGNTPKSKTVQVNSKCGSMDNINHKAGGGKTKIFNQPVHYK